jgi:hypothetical protein
MNVFVMGAEQLVSSVRGRTCAPVTGDHKASCSIFVASATFHGLVTARHFSVFATKKCCERRIIPDHLGSHCKSDEELTDIEN